MPILVLAQVVVAALAHFGVNLVLISLVVGVSARKPFLDVARTSLEITILPFALMSSAALMLVVLWQRSPFLSAALVGPLLAIALYQRSTFRELRAMRLALTDPLTGLGNHRHFHDRLERETRTTPARRAIRSACASWTSTTSSGSTTASAIPAATGARTAGDDLRQGGEAFRLGGDEFAILLPGRDEEGASDRGASRSSSGSQRSSSSPSAPITDQRQASRPCRRKSVEPRRAGPARRQRALLGEGVRQEPGARSTGPTWSRSPS